MSYAITSLHILFPLLNLALLIYGIKTQRNKWVIAALWLSFIAITLHYQTARGEILGSYFDYKESFLYSASLLVMLIGMIYLLWGFVRESHLRWARPVSSLVIAATTTGVVLLMVNLWVNARFIENRLPGSPVLQIGSFQKLDYCQYQYLFYVIDNDGKLNYLCPNYYGLFPSVGTLQTTPDYVLRLMPADVQQRLQAAKS